jgi:hypothetical protein
MHGTQNKQAHHTHGRSYTGWKVAERNSRKATQAHHRHFILAVPNPLQHLLQLVPINHAIAAAGEW